MNCQFCSNKLILTGSNTDEIICKMDKSKWSDIYLGKGNIKFTCPECLESGK